MKLPLRQKKLLSITVIIGLIIFILQYFTVVDSKILDMITFFYLMGIPVYLLTHDTLIDLNDNGIFNFWLIIGIIFWGIYFAVMNMDYKWAGSLSDSFFRII